MKVLLYAGLALSLAACSSPEAIETNGDYITHNDFESMVGWLPDGSALSKEQAHSGSYATMVNQNNEFSLTFSAPLGEVSSHKLRGVLLEAWVYLPDEKSGAQLGLQITDPAQDNKQVFGDGISLGEQVKEYNTWKKVRKEIMLPADITYAQRIKVFLWRAGATSPVYLDDLTLKAID